MKAKIKATGEIINIASYAKITLDKCDSYGTPIEVRPEDVELIANVEKDGYWQNMRVQAAIAAMQGMLSNSVMCLEEGDTYPKVAVRYADALIKELRKENSYGRNHN